MIHELIPWRTLTRFSIPPLKVARRPLEIGEVTIPVGATLDPELFPPNIRVLRLRQFYEQRRLEPLEGTKDSRQFYREQQARLRGEVIAPIQPVASQIVASLPTQRVPMASQGKPKPKGATRR